MSKIIFTLCSNNYLARAKALGDSILQHNSDYKFIICLCDKKHSDIDYSFFEPHQVIEANNINIDKFDKMCSRYNIIELNTSVKPFVFDYIFNKYKDVEYIMYFDPDTYVFDKLTEIEEELKVCSILLTPHIYTPIEFDGKNPTENTFTQHGMYNLGFLGLKRSEDTNKLLDWWKKRLEVNCYINYENGVFVDQLPMNFAPIFFNNVKISNNWGLNVAPWNLQERNLTLNNDKYFINNKYPLIFYHFSNCDPYDLDSLSITYTRVKFDQNQTLKQMYDSYKQEVINNKHNLFININCVYSFNKNKDKKLKNNLLYKLLNKFEQIIIRKCIKRLKNKM